MAKKFLDKMMGIIGLDEEVIEEEKLEDMQEENNNWGKRKAASNVVSLHTQRQVQVVLAEPTSYEEVQSIAENVKNYRPVIVNLEKVDTDMARRVIDFMSGATYGLNGSMQKVGQNIFLFVPNNVEINNELKEQVREKGIFSIFN